jgi:cytochrome c biogenesis protein CcmG, thiol:disulfide interchange protein DsbE
MDGVPKTQRDSRQPVKQRSSMILLAVAGLIIVILVVAFVTLSAGEKGPALDQQAPEFRLATFGGESLSLDSLPGRIVVLHFFASWCPPCREEAPTTQRLWTRYSSRGVRFVGVAYKDVDAKAISFAKQYGWDFPIGPDERNQVSGAYRVTGVPETYVIDQRGILVRKYIGAINEADFVRTVDGLLGANP